MINGIKPDYIKSKDYESAMEAFLETVRANHLKRAGFHKPDYSVKKGRRFDKVISENSVYCFVEKDTGNIYKPASWRAPYLKGENAIRASIYNKKTYEKAGPYGGWLYII